ncbi:MAG: 2-acylglycerophosphoethanolamine acyltransferase [Robiginitomaculum sp.]|nr:MAG: 2-acylglycerophosphoethanolamine acyltransferase [Robiginitomaculum sp.]
MAKFNEKKTHISIFGALLRARKEFGGKKEAILDADDRVLTYTEIIRASFALGSALKAKTAPKEKVGILLPTGAGSILAFFALQTTGRVPAMLNFTAGTQNLVAAFKAAQITKVITAHRFIEMGQLEPLVESLKSHVEIIYLEDIRDGLTKKNKIVAVLGSLMPSLFMARPNYNEIAVILFTSGTEGNPKGVALSHKNLVSNVEQVRVHIPELYPETDIVFNPLPTFHCFGLTGGTLLPLFAGMKVALYPSPLHVKIIPARIKEVGATISFATDTFISRYGRAGKDGALSGLRFVVCGAEQVREETRAFLKKKHGLVILEGYGVTETSPILAVNQPTANRSGTVGHIMPGMEMRIDPITGIEKGGRLFVRGPNVMLGYILSDNPGVVVPLEGGWHDTGDVVEVDDDGYIAIRGRVKRFANIAGETISLAVVENCAKAVWPENEHVALIMPHPKKGEQIIVLSDCPDANRVDILTWAQQHGVPELSVPRKVIVTDEIPLLGTGKVDYQGAQKLMESLLD